jgi:hypothetical protein
VGRVFGERERDTFVPGQWRSEGLLVADVARRFVQCGLCAADAGQRQQRAGEVETAEYRAERRSFITEQRVGRHFGVVQVQYATAHHLPPGILDRRLYHADSVQRNEEGRYPDVLTVAHGLCHDGDRLRVRQHGDRCLLTGEHITVFRRGCRGADGSDVRAAFRLGQS